MVFLLAHQLIGGVSGPGLDLPGAGGQLDAARGAVEVVGVVRLAAEPQRLAVDDGAEDIWKLLLRNIDEQVAETHST